MNKLIPDIGTLRKVVKVNASQPYESIEPYIDDALDIYIQPVVGRPIIEKATSSPESELTRKLLRALGPLTLMLATDELGVMYGDSGITVDNVQGKRSPASDAKIAAAKENLRFRGMQALDRLISYLEDHREDHPEYAGEAITPFCFISSAREFQDVGLVNIDYSVLSFRVMLPTIRQIQERNVREMLPPVVFEDLRKSLFGGEATDTHHELVTCVIRYLANKTAELYTSEKSREQRIHAKQTEFVPVIRPIYQDPETNGNFFASQAEYYAGKIRTLLIGNAESLSIDSPVSTMNFNSKEKKIFTSIS